MKYDFPAINAAALARFDDVMSRLRLEGGKCQGREYLPLNPKRDDKHPGSFSINMDSGVWGEYATGDKGGDLVSLAAYIFGCNNGEAAKRLGDFLGLSEVHTCALNQPPPPKAKENGSPAGGWVFVPFAPADAPPLPAPPYRYAKRYRYTSAAGALAFVVDRVEKGDGTKEFKQVSLWRSQSGALKWRFKAPLHPRPLYGLQDLTTRNNAPVMVCEGEKATEAARELFPAFVVVCWPGGGNAVGYADFSPLAGRDVTLWHDLDDVGREAMGKVAARLQGLEKPPTALYQVRPEFFGLSEKGDDAADVKGWNAERCKTECKRGEWRTVIGMGKEEKPPKKTKAPRVTTIGRFELADDGVYCIETGSDGNKSRKWICAPLEIIGKTTNADNTGWGLYVRFKDFVGCEHNLILRRSLFLGECYDVIRQFLEAGLKIGAGKAAKTRLIEYLESANPVELIHTTERLGWQLFEDTRVYVLPNAAYGTGNEVWLYGTDDSHDNQFTISGTAAEWRENVASLCAGNSRLSFAVSLSFAAPLLALTQPASESGGFHFRGNSSSGKSTVLRVAASVCGGRYVEGWRTTDNALESIAEKHNDAALILDELGELDSFEAGRSAYMLANGRGKGRATRTGGRRRIAAWRLLFLSAGELSLAQHMAESGKTARAGQELRLADIPADAGAGLGVWEDLHGSDNGADFSTRLDHATGKYYGAVYREFLERLAKTPADEITRRVADARRRLVEAYLSGNASGQARRVAGRFALVAAGGELATEWGLTGWRPAEADNLGEAEQAAGTCLAAWLEARGGEGNQEERAMLEQVRGYLEKYGSANFDQWHRLSDPHAPRTLKRVGVVRWCYPSGEVVEEDNNTEGVHDRADIMSEFFIYPEGWKHEVCKGFDDKVVARVMAQRGYLKCAGKKRYTYVQKIRGIGGKRVYYVLPHFLGDVESPANG
jgi:uncharacterized protein (DUF927 family)